MCLSFLTNCVFLVFIINHSKILQSFSCLHIVLNKCFSICIVGAGSLVVWASALHTKGRGFDSRDGTFLDFFFCLGICCAGVDFCCLSLTVPIWVGKIFLLPCSIYSVHLCVFTWCCRGCMVPFQPSYLYQLKADQ